MGTKRERSSRRMRHLHLGMFFLWCALSIPGVILWRDSVFFVVACSLFANIYTTLSAYQGSRAEESNQ